MLRAQIESKLIVAGLSFGEVTELLNEGAISTDIAIPAGKAGSLTTRTNNTEGVITCSDHGFEEADALAIFWAGGSRYNVTISTHNTGTLTFTGGAGDNLPTELTAVVISKQYTISETFNGDNVSVIALQADQRTVSVFEESDNSVHMVKDLAANGLFSYASSSGLTSPVASAVIDHIDVANGSTSIANYKLAVMYNSSTV